MDFMQKLSEIARNAYVSNEPNICDGNAMCPSDGSMWDHQYSILLLNCIN